MISDSLSVLNLILSIVLFGALPLLIGGGVLRALGSLEFGLAKRYIAGLLAVWTVIEVIAIPVTILKKPFTWVVISTGVLLVVICVFEIVSLIRGKQSDKSVTQEPIVKSFKNKWDVIAFALLVIGFVVMVFFVERTLFYDADDSRFVVNAIDILKHNRILASNPATGLPLQVDYDDFNKDLVGQWAAFLAFGSYVTRTHPTIWAHMIYPVVGLLALVSVYWLLISELMKVDKLAGKHLTKSKDEASIFDRSLVMIVILALYAWGFVSDRYAEGFTMIRIWQGKGTLASVGILIIIYAFIIVARRPDRREGYLLLLMANIAACLMTSNGIIFAALMTGAYGFVMAIYTKRIKTLILSVLICVPDVLLYIISEVYTIQMFLN